MKQISTVKLPGEFDKRYSVTKDGKVYSHYKNRYLSDRSSDSYGYLVVGLYNSYTGKHKTYTVHKLVALVHIPNPNNYKCINHKDGNKLNNTVDNLEWCTNEYNCRHQATLLNKTSKYVGIRKHKGKWESRIKIKGERTQLGTFVNEVDAARAYNDYALKHLQPNERYLNTI